MTLLHNIVGLVTIDLNNIDFDDDNFNEDDPVNNVLLWLVVLHNRFKPCKVCEKKDTQRTDACSKSVGLVYNSKNNV